MNLLNITTKLLIAPLLQAKTHLNVYFCNNNMIDKKKSNFFSLFVFLYLFFTFIYFPVCEVGIEGMTFQETLKTNTYTYIYILIYILYSR